MFVDWRQMPTMLSLLMGEFLYQLRAALDSCIYEATVLETGQSPPPDERNLGWPICATQAQFQKASRSIRALSEFRRAHVETYQPFNAGHLPPEFRVISESLGWVNDLARIDRHRRLHIVGGWASRISPKLTLPPGVTVQSRQTMRDGFLEDESEVVRFALAGWQRGMELEGNPDLLIDVMLDELPPPRTPEDTIGDRTRWMVVSTEVVTRAMAKSFGFGFEPGESREPSGSD